ncbi:peptide chain release factor N(5)-glutamine methyltransferase [Croceibacterium aestuarii]|uniref:peptide chain release factor N(5)-glutamine methyltransferase n=1 Tax=Croceibacterium aestuarii TaxID=3064139 RepID=UPI00272E0B6E|nr:peptide chain release factor N(5)-glutamine methyltransferase [Croceibacterium sp. D39]
MITVAEALRDATRRLGSVSDTARLDAEFLMADALRVSRSELLLKRMAEPQPEGFEAWVARRERGEPLAYIVGVQEFFGLPFAVSSDVLIPRADSETTLRAALEAAPSASTVLDCGTGSGALLLAFLHERPAAAGVGIDRATQAVAVARKNAAHLGLAGRCELRVADWNAPGWSDDLGRFDLVIANPPYVETGADLDRSVRDFEPAGALYAGPEGLDAYAVLIPQISDLLATGGAAVLEIGAAQADAVAELARRHGFSSELHRDLADRPRALVLRLSTWQSAME